MDNLGIFLLCIGFVAAPFVVWGAVELVRRFLLKSATESAVLKKKDVVKQEKFSGKFIKRYVLEFETDEKKLRFYVSDEQYSVARVGKRGVLKHKGSRFISFD